MFFYVGDISTQTFSSTFNDKTSSVQTENIKFDVGVQHDKFYQTCSTQTERKARLKDKFLRKLKKVNPLKKKSKAYKLLRKMAHFKSNFEA